MEEVKASALPPPLQYELRQLIILLAERRHILLADGIPVLRRRHHRLHGYLREAQIRQMPHILREIEVGVGKCPSDEIPDSVTGPRHLLEPGHYGVVGALAARSGAHPVVDLLAPVYGEDYIAHLPVGEFKYLIGQERAVGGESEAELLIMLSLQASAVLHQRLDHGPVHQRLAEEVHLEIAPVSRAPHQEVQRSLTHLEAHEASPVTVIGSLICEAVRAAQITVVGYIEAQRLDYGLPASEVVHGPRILVLRKKRSGGPKGEYLVQPLCKLLLRIPGIELCLPAEPVRDILSVNGRGILTSPGRYDTLHLRDQIIDHLVHHMYGAAVDIHDYAQSVTYILMDHCAPPRTKTRQLPHCPL